MSPELTAIIGLMGTALTALGGFVMYMFRSTLTRYEKRIDVLESRESQTLDTLAHNIEGIQGMMQTMVEAFKELRMALEYSRRVERRE